MTDHGDRLWARAEAEAARITPRPNPDPLEPSSPQGVSAATEEIRKLKALLLDARSEIMEERNHREKLENMTRTLTKQRDKLQEFKDFVHNRLDLMGVEKEPNGIHSAAGCRIGDRLNIVASWALRAEKAEEALHRNGQTLADLLRLESWRKPDEDVLDGIDPSDYALKVEEKLRRPLLSFIETIESTGGVTADLAPVEAPAWQDLGEAYAEACSALGAPMKQTKEG